MPREKGLPKEKGLVMKIILVGGGKVGTALARQLSEEVHSKPNIEDLVVNNDIVMKWGDGFTKPHRFEWMTEGIYCG